MNRVLYILRRTFIALLMCSIVVACKEEKEIPEDDLVNIFRDAFIANAYLAQEGIQPNDSLIIYEPILEKYGYTVEDLRTTLQSLSQRKSARVSDLLTKASELLDEEAAIERHRLAILDTIDNIAKREYTRTIYHDSLIHVKRLKDTAKLQISIKDIIPGDYKLSFNYYIDTLDQNRNSRVEVYMLKNDTIELKRYTQMLNRYKGGQFMRTFNVDTTMSEIYVNIFYHPSNEEPKRPDVKVTDLKMVRVLPLDTAVDSLYLQHFDLRLFNHSAAQRLVLDTVSYKPMHMVGVDTLRNLTFNWLERHPILRDDDES